MDHDEVVTLLSDPAAVIGDAGWLAVQEHWAVCDVCAAGSVALTSAVQGELSLIRFRLDRGPSFLRPWWFGIPIVGLVLMLGSLSYVFFGGPLGEPSEPALSSTPSPAHTVTVVPMATPTFTATPTPVFTAQPTPTSTPALPGPTAVPASPAADAGPLVTPTPGPPVEPLTPAPTAPPQTEEEPSLCATSCTPTDISLVGEVVEDSAYAGDLFRLTTDLRAQAGLGPLTPDSRLVAAAREYARFVALSRWWSTHSQPAEIHCGADCRDMYDRAVAAGYPPACVGENVMWGSIGVTPAQTWGTLLASPYEDPARPVFDYVGIACYFREDLSEFACVQVLAAEGGAPCAQ